MAQVIDFHSALAKAEKFGTTIKCSKKRLLLGNGFSIGCMQKFNYPALYEKAVELGLPQHIQKVFDYFGQCNFEAVLKALDDGHWLAELYDLKSSDKCMARDYEAVKEALAKSISEVHPDKTSDIETTKYSNCYSFIQNFDDIYTLNYDLLLYWTSLSQEPFQFEDYFTKYKSTPSGLCEFSPSGGSNKKHIYFLHGALHLFTEGGQVYKRIWNDVGISLIEQIRNGLKNKEYPLVVAEGDNKSKLKQIESSSYLWNCLRKFNGIEGQLFIHGHSLADQDDHIFDEIVNNLSLRKIWVGLFGDPDSDENQRKILKAKGMVKKRQEILDGLSKTPKGKKGNLELGLYQSESANVWGS